MLFRRIFCCILWLSVGTGGWASTQSPRFSLQEVEELFPSQGFEDSIAFWKHVFTELETRQVIFHDLDDLRLVYYEVGYAKGIEGDPAEAKRQRELLKDERKKLERWFDEIRRLGVDSPSLNENQRAIVSVLERAGYRVDDRLLRRLSQNFRYQRGVREKFRQSLIRSGSYIDEIERILQSYDLPLELAALPHLESSFDYNAYSKAGAAGIWQFTRGTGREYLSINRWVDERLDPIQATHAAARLFRDNFEALGNWPLTITSYNHGRYGMIRAKKRHGPDLRKIVENYQSRYFGFASRNFYPEFLATLEVTRNAELYFGPLEINSPLRFDTVQLRRAYDASYFTSVPGISEETLAHLNPHLRAILAPSRRVIPAGTQVRVPFGLQRTVEETLESAQPTGAAVILAADGSTRYRVQPGDSLGWIATEFGTSVRDLQRLNGLSNPHRIYPSQILLVSAPAPGSSGPLTPSSSPGPTASVRYTVRKGDNLSIIARRFGTSVAALQRANSLRNPSRIQPGTELIIGGPDSMAPSSYVVRKGDTLAGIARQFGTSVRALQAHNNIRNADRIEQGQKLVIPRGRSR